jgi:hypothetical protein
MVWLKFYVVDPKVVDRLMNDAKRRQEQNKPNNTRDLDFLMEERSQTGD